MSQMNKFRKVFQKRRARMMRILLSQHLWRITLELTTIYELTDSDISSRSPNEKQPESNSLKIWNVVLVSVC